MPKISVAGLEARQEVKKVSKGYDERAPLRAAIADLSEHKTLRIEPDAGETMRKLKVMIRRAAKEVNREIKYGETEAQHLMVWLAETIRRRARGRPKKDGSSEETAG